MRYRLELSLTDVEGLKVPKPIVLIRGSGLKLILWVALKILAQWSVQVDHSEWTKTYQTLKRVP